MATVFRGPLLSGKLERAPLYGLLVIAVPSLLCTTLAPVLAIPLPLSSAKSFPLQAQVRPGLFPNADTSHGTPKTLLPPDPRQKFLPLQFAPQSKWGLFPNADTSHGTPKTLLPPDPRQRFLALHLPPQSKPGLYPYQDTTQDQPLTLKAPPAPFTIAPPLVPQLHWWQPRDSSAGIPKTLLEELRTAPFVVLQQEAIDRAFGVTDTSRGTPETLFPVAVVANPFPTAPQPCTPQNQWQPADSSASVPKTLKDEATLPFGVLQQTPPDRVRPVTDTSVGSSPSLLTTPLPPVGKAEVGLAYFLRQPADTSQGLALILTAAGNVDRVVTVPPANITFAGQPPTVINTSVVAEELGGIGGRHELRRHRRIVVEIDGELFEVRSEQEGIRLLQQARELAQATADHAATAAVAKAEKSRRPQTRARALAMRVPTLKLVDADYSDADVQRMQAQVDAARVAIEETYARAMRMAQAAFIANRDRDEEDTVAALLFDAQEEEALVRELIDRLGMSQGKRKTTKSNNERS
jgi:hypothetical protein